MADLSHWVYANDFTGFEAAYLILGADLSSGDATDSRSAGHILKRLESAYAGAFDALCFAVHVKPCLAFDDDIDAAQKNNMPEREQLICIEMQRLRQGWKEGDEISISAWLETGRNSFREQRFSRGELTRWISDNHLPSAYLLDSEPLKASTHGSFEKRSQATIQTPPSTRSLWNG